VYIALEDGDNELVVALLEAKDRLVVFLTLKWEICELCGAAL